MNVNVLLGLSPAGIFGTGGGSIASGQVAVGTGSDTIGGSAALTFSGGVLASNAALTIQSTNVTVSTQQFDISGNFNGILGILAANANSGTASKTQFTAANDTGQQLYFGITSSTFTGNPNAAFIGSSVPLTINASVSIESELALLATAAPSPVSGETIIYMDSSTNQAMISVNGATAAVLAGTGSSISAPVTGVAAAASNSTGNVTTITCPAGAFILHGQVVIHGGSTGLTVGTALVVAISTASGGSGTLGLSLIEETIATLQSGGIYSFSLTLPVSNASSKQYWLTVNIQYAGGSPTFDGNLIATRLL